MPRRTVQVKSASLLLRDAVRLYTRSGFVPVDGAAAGSFARRSDPCDRASRLALTAPA